MKKIILYIIAALVILGVGIYGALTLWLNAKLDPTAIAALTQKEIGAPLCVGARPAYSIFPPAVTAENLSLNLAAWRIEAQKCRIELDLSAFFSKKFTIRNIKLEQPQVTYTQMASSDAPAQQSGSSTGASWLIQRLEVQQGNFICQIEDNAIQLNGINLLAENIGVGVETAFKSDFLLEYIKDSRTMATGNMAIKAKYRYEANKLALPQAALTYTATQGLLADIFSPAHLTGEFALNFDNLDFCLAKAKLELPQGEMTVNGDGNMRQGMFEGNTAVNVAGDALPGNFFNKQHHLTLSSAVILKNSELTLDDGQIKIADCEGKATININWASTPMQAHAKIAMGALNLDELITDNADSASATSEQAAAQSSWQDKAWPDVSLELEIASIKYHKFLLTQFEAEVAGKSGKYASRKFACNWSDGLITGLLNADFPENDLTFSLAGQKINLGSALAQFGVNGIRDGLADISAKLNFKNLTREKMLANLFGNGQLECQGAKIPVLMEIGRLVPVPSGRKFVFPDQVDKLTAKWAVSAGIAAFKPISLQAGSLKVEGNAVANLLQERLDGNLQFDLFGMKLPVIFKGPFNDVSWHVGSNFFKELKKLIP